MDFPELLFLATTQYRDENVIADLIKLHAMLTSLSRARHEDCE